MAVWAIVQEQSTILLVKRSDQTTRAGQWCLPGGGIKMGETPEQACLRETEEETQLLTRISSCAARVGNDLYFCCQLENPSQPVVLKSDECSDYVWVQPVDLIKVGIVMNLRVLVPMLRSLGYDVNLPDDLERYVG